MSDHATIRDAPARHALIVDSDYDTRQMYAEYLKLNAWDIAEAGDGRQALAKALAHPPDIVVTETHLPGISGYELCRLLREDPVTVRTKLVVVTADARPVDCVRAMNSGADLVLTKPCLPADLVSEIRRLFERAAELPRGSEARRREIGPRLSRAPSVVAPSPPPSLCCPECHRQLAYQRSHVGGVGARHPEQWDYYDCGNGCGTFQYRTRTRKLRRFS